MVEYIDIMAPTYKNMANMNYLYFTCITVHTRFLRKGQYL